MIKRKQIISKLLATTMCVSTFTSSVSAATVSSTTLAGADRYETAVKVSESGWTSATNAVIINGDKGLVDALTATPYASLKNAPILVTEKDKLTTTTKNRLKVLGVKNVDIVGGEAVVSQAVVDELKAMGIIVNRISGSDRYSTSVAVANEIKKLTTVTKIAVVNGATGLPDAVSIAAVAADNKMPILLSDPNNNKGIAEAQSFISSNNISKSYVIGQTSAVSDSIMNSLPGTKVRLGGSDRHDTNAKVIKEFYTSTSLDNIYVAKSGYVKNNEELVDALAVGVLAAKNDDPVLIVGNNLGDSQEDLLTSKTFTKITQVGNGIPSNSIQEIKDTQKDPEAKVSSITLVDYKTIKISGTELDRLSSSNISLSGNTVASYTSNTAGTQATIVFNNTFSSGTNTLKVTSNLGNTTSHTFTYTSSISSVEATTKEIALNGIQYLEFTVNGGQTKTVEELEALGWEVEFESATAVFYSEKDPTKALKTSTTGKLMTSGFTDGQIFSYKVTLTKGSTVITTSEDRFITAKASAATNIVSIDSYDVKFNDGRDLISNKLLVGESVNINNIIGTQKDGKEANIDENENTEITTSDSTVLSVSGNTITARKIGTAEITITNGDTTETISIKVVDADTNTRKIKSVKFYLDDTLKSSIKLTLKEEPDTTTLTVRAFDQFGDPINATIDEEVTLSKDIADVSMSSYKFAENGESTLELTPKATGSATLKLQITHSGSTTATTLGSLSVSVAEATSKESYTLTRVGGDSEDLTLDRYAYKNDGNVILQLNAYDSNGNLIGGKNMTTDDEYEYILKYDSDLVEAKIIKEEEKEDYEPGRIRVKTLEGTETGTSTVAVYKVDTDNPSKQTLVKSVSIKVIDTTPVLSSVKMNSIATITEVNKKENEFNLTELFDISYEKLTNALGKNEKDNEAYYKKIVENITVSGYPNQEVLMSTSEAACEDSKGGDAILFIDRDADGQYGTEDFILATLKIERDTVTGEIKDGGFKLDSETKNGKIIVGLYDGEYDSTKSPKDTEIVVKINN